MSKIIEKATAHFRNQISGEMKSVDVPEWETKIFYKTATSLKDEGRVLELTQQGKTVEALVEGLIIKARNEDGTKMFTVADKATLLNEVDPRILIRVVSDINSVSQEELDLENAEKN
jgi:hypothetical protein